MTVHHERAILICLWRWAFEQALVDSMPRGLVKVKKSKPPTKAWTLEQCCTGVKGTYRLDGTRLRGGADLGQFLRCWILLGYETGARQGDLWKMRDTDFDLDSSTVYWSQNKTGNPVPKVLTPACIAAVRAMLAKSPDGTVLRWVMVQSSGQRRMKAYLKTLHMSGTSKWLRRSSATHIEMLNPGKGKLHLGHLTPGMFERYYADWSQITRDIPRAPVLIEQ